MQLPISYIQFDQKGERIVVIGKDCIYIYIYLTVEKDILTDLDNNFMQLERAVPI